MFKAIFMTAAIAVFLLSRAAMAQDSTGFVTGQFDGHEMQWYVTSDNGKSQSDWTDMGPLASVNIFAHSSADTISDTKGAFVIGFQIFNMAKTPTVASPSITFMKDGYNGMFGSHDDAIITLEEASIEGDLFHLKGHFEGDIYYSTDHLRTLDTDNPKPVSGQFDVTLGPVLQ